MILVLFFYYMCIFMFYICVQNNKTMLHSGCYLIFIAFFILVQIGMFWKHLNDFHTHTLINTLTHINTKQQQQKPKNKTKSHIMNTTLEVQCWMIYVILNHPQKIIKFMLCFLFNGIPAIQLASFVSYFIWFFFVVFLIKKI